jgi:nucleoside-diphosphate-sugar epimerase
MGRGGLEAAFLAVPRPADPRRRCPDISKAGKLLGWGPRTPLEEGLRLTIRWFEEVLPCER